MQGGTQQVTLTAQEHSSTCTHNTILSYKATTTAVDTEHVTGGIFMLCALQCCTCLEHPNLLLAVLVCQVILSSSGGRGREGREEGLDHFLNGQVVLQASAATGSHCSAAQQPEGDQEPR